MDEPLEAVLGVALAVFMAGNLLDMGLRVNLHEARTALRDVRFTVAALLWAFVMCPALAVLLTTVVPLEAPYATGLLLLGMAPCAPFLPAVAARAGGDLAYVAAFMVLASVGTVVFMPVAVPLLVDGITAGAWTIARPLVSLIATPLLIGAIIHAEAPGLAARLQPIAKNVTLVATALMVVLVAVIYGRDFVGAIGTYAIAAQLAFLTLTTAGAYALSVGVPDTQKRVLALGLCTRNIGAAVAPLYAAPGTDQRAVVMVALAVPITVVGSIIAARWFARRATAVRPASEGEHVARVE